MQLQTRKLRHGGNLEEVLHQAKAQMNLLFQLFLTCSRKCFRVTQLVRLEGSPPVNFSVRGILGLLAQDFLPLGVYSVGY